MRRRTYNNKISSDSGKYQVILVEYSSNSPASVKVSQDYGKTWKEVNDYIYSHYTSGVISSDGKHIIIVESYSAKLLVSSDFGSTFKAATIPSILKHITANADCSVIYGFNSENELVKSTTYGAAWIKTGFSDSSIIQKMLCDNTGENICFDYYLFKRYYSKYSNDGGLSFSNSTGHKSDIKLCEIQENKVLGFSTEGTGLYLSEDFGKSFTLAPFDKPSSVFDNFVLCSSKDLKHVYFAGRTNSSYRLVEIIHSSDGGKSFTHILSIPSDSNGAVTKMSCSSDGRHVKAYVHADKKYLYQSSDFGRTWRIEEYHDYNTIIN